MQETRSKSAVRGGRGAPRGATLIGYALLLGLVSLIGTVAVTDTGVGVKNLFGRVSEALVNTDSAESRPPTPLPPCVETTETFAAATETDIFSIPAGCTHLDVAMWGAGGGAIGSFGGGGAFVEATLSITGPADLVVIVGEGGQGSDGGGRSAIRLQSETEDIVTAGGGGGGITGATRGGGAAGDTSSAADGYATSGQGDNEAGKGASASAGGAAGTPNTRGTAPEPGSKYTGGNGGDLGGAAGQPKRLGGGGLGGVGGGGGGGYFGGGGGSHQVNVDGGGGGGGTSYVGDPRVQSSTVMVSALANPYDPANISDPRRNGAGEGGNGGDPGEDGLVIIRAYTP